MDKLCAINIVIWDFDIFKTLKIVKYKYSLQIYCDCKANKH